MKLYERGNIVQRVAWTTRRSHRPPETLARRKTLGTEMQPRSFVHLIRKSEGRREMKWLGCAWISVEVESGQNEPYILSTTKCICCSEPGTDILPGWWIEEEVCEWLRFTSTPSVDSGLRCSLGSCSNALFRALWRVGCLLAQFQRISDSCKQYIQTRTRFPSIQSGINGFPWPRVHSQLIFLRLCPSSFSYCCDLTQLWPHSDCHKQCTQVQTLFLRREVRMRRSRWPAVKEDEFEEISASGLRPFHGYSVFVMHSMAACRGRCRWCSVRIEVEMLPGLFGEGSTEQRPDPQACTSTSSHLKFSSHPLHRDDTTPSSLFSATLLKLSSTLLPEISTPTIFPPLLRKIRPAYTLRPAFLTKRQSCEYLPLTNLGFEQGGADYDAPA